RRRGPPRRRDRGARRRPDGRLRPRRAVRRARRRAGHRPPPTGDLPGTFEDLRRHGAGRRRARPRRARPRGQPHLADGRPGASCHNEPMNDLVVDIALVFLFVLVGGGFAASEIALVSPRERQVRALAERGGAGARVARLVGDSNRFLSSVQIGVTLAGFFSASFGAAQISPQVAPLLEQLGLGSGPASTVAFVGITVLISYLSLVFGELVPKRLAMQRAERFSMRVASPHDWNAAGMRLVIWLIGASTVLVMRLLGRDPDAQREEIGAEELRALVAEHESLGPVEREM